MDSVIGHPAVQSGIIPFITALVIMFFFGKFRPAFMGLAALAAFVAAVGLVMGYSLQPWSATKKIILLAYVAAGLGLAVDLVGGKLISYRKFSPGIFGLLGVLALLWVIWPIISQEEAQTAATIALGLSAYVAWIVFAIGSLQDKKLQASAAVFALGMGTALVSIIGASALYGQLAAPFAAAAGAWLLYYLVAPQKAILTASFFLPASLACALLGAAATVNASLSWVALALLALVPLTVFIPIKQDSAVWSKILKSYLAALVPVIAAVWFTARQSAESSYYG